MTPERNAPDGRRVDVPETDWRRVSPKLVWTELVSVLLVGIVITAGVALIGSVNDGTARFVWIAIAVVAAVVTILVAAFTPRRVRAIGYALRDDDLVMRRGLMWQRFTAVPYGRLQLVDVSRGPLGRVLGLSELRFVTAAAATNVRLPGLPAETADELRDRLVDLAESRRVGL
jgi:uncharacterized protein